MWHMRPHWDGAGTRFSTEPAKVSRRSIRSAAALPPRVPDSGRSNYLPARCLMVADWVSNQGTERLTVNQPSHCP